MTFIPSVQFLLSKEDLNLIVYTLEAIQASVNPVVVMPGGGCRCPGAKQSTTLPDRQQWIFRKGVTD